MRAARIVVTADVQRIGDRNINFYAVVRIFFFRSGRSLPGGPWFRESRSSLFGLGNNSLAGVIGCAQSQTIPFQPGRHTINGDTGLGECKHLALSIISEPNSIHDRFCGNSPDPALLGNHGTKTSWLESSVPKV